MDFRRVSVTDLAADVRAGRTAARELVTHALERIDALHGAVNAIVAVDEAYPGIAFRVLDDHGSLRRFVNIFVADEDVRFLQGLDTVLEAGQTVSLVPAVAGGC